uniref:Uncharacterized protein n=1 Tax=Bos indicus x Bos taurus TaxID=30522 RepID=A0A4W2ICF7_BOBOX
DHTRPGTACPAVTRNTQVSPPRLSRVNGWSRPLHSFQIMAWTVFLTLAFTTFGVFIPLLPRDWRYIAYSVTGGIFFFHFLVHLIAISIDPAEASVRLKNYSQPMPTFDRSKHPHVIQNQYCHLCEVTVCPTDRLPCPPFLPGVPKPSIAAPATSVSQALTITANG